jgi:hypothetical protein
MWKRFFRRRKRPITKEEIMAAIDDLTTQVGRVVAGIDALISKVNAGDNSAALQGLADSLHAAADKADAIVNPPVPAPAPAPAPAPTA